MKQVTIKAWLYKSMQARATCSSCWRFAVPPWAWVAVVKRGSRKAVFPQFVLCVCAQWP